MTGTNQDAIDAIELALSMLNCSQKDLALKLKVSPTQISKWKKGEYMSLEMEERIKELTKIGNHHPAVVLWAGSVKNAEKWEKLFHDLAEIADEVSETGYDTYPLQDDMGLLGCAIGRASMRSQQLCCEELPRTDATEAARQVTLQ